MSPHIGIILAVWFQANPAEPTDRAAVIWREVFPDKEICEVALLDRLNEAHDDYRGIRTMRIQGRCLPAE